MKGLYIHIPFCQYICHYCDFVKSVPRNQDVVDTYIDRLIDELNLYKNHFSSIDTIYIGGGTPSMLNVSQLTKLFDALKPIKPIEFSIELNPETYTKEKGLLFKKYNVNRISIGVQTFDDDILKFINRGHKTDDVFNVVNDLRAQGINQISIDLMFAIPGQTINHIKKDLKMLKKLNVDHVSYYSLILEDKTYFYHQMLRGKLTLVNQDTEALMYELIQEELAKQGFLQYEISNYAKNNLISLHNSIYWSLDPYIGIGLGAFGFIDNYRTQNERSMVKYLDHFQKEKVFQTEESLLQDELIFGLRKKIGVSISAINQKYQIDLLKKFNQIDQKIQEGLLEIEGDYLKLTKKGFMLGNQVFMLFI